ncbi:MAG: oligosaccharide flippase family protein [Candidatus Omnitrophica bacterium]|nr:oligosaccharide flippase family protein [Candidatus Omnitrophota bacterium]
MRKKDIIGNIVSYSAGRYISQFIGFFISVLMRNFLGPLYTGMWGLIRVFMGYASYNDLGALQFLYFKVPYFKGGGDIRKVNEIQGTVFAFMFLMNALVALVFLIAAFFLKGRIAHELFIGFLVLPVFFIIQRVMAFYTMLLRAHKDFKILGGSYIFDSAMNLLLIVLLVARFKIYGMYALSVILPVLNIAYVFCHVRYEVVPVLDWKKITEYVKFGFPISISASCIVLFYSVDSMMIAKMLGLIPLGYYSIATMARSYTTELSQNFASVLSPYFIEDLGRSKDVSATGRYVIRYTEITSGIMSLILGAGFIFLPVFFKYTMPDFGPGIGAMKMMLVCTFFIVLSGHIKNYLIVNNRVMFLLFTTLGAIAVNAGLNYFAIRNGFGITGVAVSSSIAAMLMFLVISVDIFGLVKGVSFTGYLARTFLPFILVFLVVFAIGSYVKFGNEALELAVKTVLYGLFTLAGLAYIDKNTGIGKILLELVSDKIKRKKTSDTGGASG